MTEIMVILLMAFVTYLFRFLPLLFFRSEDSLPYWVWRWFKYIPPAILALITVQAASDAIRSSAVSSSVFDPLYFAYIACAFVALKTKKLFPSLVTGMLLVVLITVLF